jgi:hypothetical protein
MDLQTTIEFIRDHRNDLTLFNVNYPTLLALTRSLRVGLPASKTHFAGTEMGPTGSAVSTGVPSECPTPTGSTG